MSSVSLRLPRFTPLHEAGSQLVLTNSFGSTALRPKLHDAQDRVHELNSAGSRIARRAADDGRERTGHEVVVAKSVGPTGELFATIGALDYDDAYAAFIAQATALAEGWVDKLWVETMSLREEVKAAITAAAANDFSVAASMTFDTAAKNMMGVPPAEFAIQSAGFGAGFVGANCRIGPA